MTEALPWHTQEELETDDAEYLELQQQIKYNEAVADRARSLRIDRDAKARLRAEEATGTDFDPLFLDREQLRDLPVPVPLIEGVLPRNVYGVLRGRDQSFKSFVALDWAACLATGKPWQGHALEPARVLYIAGEGADGISRRLDAWEFAWGRKIDPKQFVTRRLALNMYEPGPAYDHLLEHITSGGYALVVVDTLRRVSGNADGNGSEMGRVIDNLDQIKHATAEGSVLVISHTDKHDVDTRGYSGIEDDADVVWAAKRDDMLLKLELTKMKDGADGRTMHLEATRTLHSLILAESTRTQAAVSNEHQLAILDALRVTYRDGARPNDLIAATGIPKATLYRALNELEDADHVRNTGTKRQKYYEIPPLTDDPETSETQPPEDHHA